MGNRSALAQRAELAALGDTRRELAALEAMTVGELAEKYRAVFGVPTRTRNKEYLRRHIAWRIQAQVEGGLAKRALERIAELAPQAPARWREPVPKLSGTSGQEKPGRDPRLPPAGTVLTRVYEGVEHRVKILDDGFEYQGKRHRSLSQIARLVTRTPWNGFTFFLGRAAGKPGSGAGGAR